VDVLRTPSIQFDTCTPRTTPRLKWELHSIVIGSVIATNLGVYLYKLHFIFREQRSDPAKMQFAFKLYNMAQNCPDAPLQTLQTTSFW